MPRNTKLTPGLHRAIVHAVAEGVGYVQAAGLAGIAETTASQWRRRGQGTDGSRRPTPLYVAFAADLQKAEAENEARCIRLITEAGEGGAILSDRTTTYRDGRVVREVTYARPEWTANAWLLERRYPERWGRRERVDLRVNIERAAARVAGELGLTVEEVLAEARLLLREVDDDAAGL